MELYIIFIWILMSLAFVSIAGPLAKKYGVEYLVATFAVLYVISNILANKIVIFGPLVVAGGILAFPLTFYLSDIITEHWGRKEAQKAIFIGFFANLLLVFLLFITLNWPAPTFALEQAEQFSNALGLTFRIVLASMVVYLVSQNLDIYLFEGIKKLTKGKYLWLRNNGSTLLSQLVDSTLFAFIAFYGVLPLAPLIIGGWIAKSIIALLDTPFIYLSSYIMNKVKRTN